GIRDGHVTGVQTCALPISLCDGTLIPVHGSSCDKAFRTGKTQHFHSFEEVRDDPEYFGSSVGRPFYQRVMAEGLVSGCDLPLIEIGRASCRERDWVWEVWG